MGGVLEILFSDLVLFQHQLKTAQTNLGVQNHLCITNLCIIWTVATTIDGHRRKHYINYIFKCMKSNLLESFLFTYLKLVRFGPKKWRNILIKFQWIYENSEKTDTGGTRTNIQLAEKTHTHTQEDNNRKGLVLSETFVVIECHVLLCDSVILVQAEFDKCIGHMRSRKPRPRWADVLYENTARPNGAFTAGPSLRPQTCLSGNEIASRPLSITPLQVLEEVGNKRMTLQSHLWEKKMCLFWQEPKVNEKKERKMNRSGWPLFRQVRPPSQDHLPLLTGSAY